MNLRPQRLLVAVLFAVLAATMARAHDPQGQPAQAAFQQGATMVVAGMVEELVVDDRVNGATVYVHALRQDDGSVVALSGAGAEALQKGARIEVMGQLRGDSLEMAAFSVLVAAPIVDIARGPTAGEKQVQGTLVVWHKDYFAEERGEYGFGIYTAAQITPLKLVVSPGTLRPGMTVSASGTTDADGVTLDATQITILAAAPAIAKPLGAQITNKVLVMPIKFSNSPASDPFTAAEVDQVMRTNTLSTAAYYNEVSYGQQALNVTVACQTTKPAGCAAQTSSGGWLVTSSPLPASCDFTTMGNLADAAATAAGYNLSNYINRFYVLPGDSGCGWAGLAYIGFPYQAWSAGYNALWVYGHELGHNFTLYHAGSLDCAPQVLGGSCSLAEYGDRFDVMGNNTSAGEQMHFNATQKALLGWIPPSSVMTQTTGSQTYTLSPIEAGGQSTYAVKIPVTGDPNRTYWIEYRQPIGLFDATLSNFPNRGAIIHVAEPFDYPCTGGCFADDTQILDMTPSTPDNFFDAALLAGQTYTDSTYGVKITVNSATASTLSVTVVAGGLPTTTTLTSSANPSTLGVSVTFTATVIGDSPTGTVAFAAGDAIAGCTAVALSGGVASCTTTSLALGAHSIVATYSGDSANAGSSSAPLTQTVNKQASTTTLATSLSPSTVGGGVTFTATVTATAPTGSVDFFDGSTSVAGCAAVALAGSGSVVTAQCTTAALTIRVHSMTATYSGDANNAGSTSAVLSQIVNSLGGGSGQDGQPPGH